jgi:hypothetical protein
MEKPNWTFFLFGLIGLPLIGRLIVIAMDKLEWASDNAKEIGFFLIPGYLLLMSILEKTSSASASSAMIRRGGQQGLLMAAGFGVAVGLLFFFGQFSDFAGF